MFTHTSERSIKQHLLSHIWAGVTFILAIACIDQAIRVYGASPKYSYATGWRTDFELALPSVNLIEYHFTGGLEVDDQYQLYRVQEPGLTQYVGRPSPEIDAAWSNMMDAAILVLDEDSLGPLKGKTTQEPDGSGYRVALDTFHALHCLNMMRKALDFDYYHPDGNVSYYYRDHVDHCIDYTRKMIQCQGDLTPLFFYYEPKAGSHGATLPIFRGARQCRDWSQIHDWARERSQILGDLDV